VDMSAQSFNSIRERIGVTQAVMAEALSVTQGNVSFYEKGQTIPPAVAGQLIEFAKLRGHAISYDDIYGGAPAVATAKA